MQDNTTDQTFFPSKTAIADLYGVARSTVYAWERAGLLGKAGKKGYHRGTVCHNVDRFLSNKDAGATGKGDQAEKTRLECARLKVVIRREMAVTEQAELDLQRQKNLVVSMEVHRQAMDEIRAMYLSGLDQIVENVSTKSRSVQVRDLLRAAVNGLRSRIAALANPTPESAAFLRQLAKSCIEQAAALEAGAK
jgi:hypothetical protein